MWLHILVGPCWCVYVALFGSKLFLRQFTCASVGEEKKLWYNQDARYVCENHFILLETDCTTSCVFANSLPEQRDHIRLFREQPALWTLFRHVRNMRHALGSSYLFLCCKCKSIGGSFLQLTLRWLMSYIYGAPILDVSRSHTTTQHSR
jgi:hypothetical protein